jgi:hypothetical protein
LPLEQIICGKYLNGENGKLTMEKWIMGLLGISVLVIGNWGHWKFGIGYY